ncbi:MAG: ribosome biogenesis GTPase Der [Burkholderiaceae bacterium]
MKPVIALVGRPNVGKSTLFNRLTRSRDALVADLPGLTRDRHFGEGRLGPGGYLVVDTGGFEPVAKDGILAEMARQTEQALQESDVAIFLTDGREGLTGQDHRIAQRLRRAGRPVLLAVNKLEGLTAQGRTAEFYELGLGEPHALSAAHGDGVHALIDKALSLLAPATKADGEARDSELEGASEVASESTHESEAFDRGLRLAIVGRPNVGKSTLVNALIGEERVIAFDQPGTTRDAIEIEFQFNDKPFRLIDTAGLRRRGRVFEAIEKFSVIKTLQAVESSNVAILVLDAQQDISDQDAQIASFITEAGRALVVAVNKWDGLDFAAREEAKRLLGRKLPFLYWAKTHFISARRGHGLDALMRSVLHAYEAATRKLSTPRLTRVLRDAVERQQPARRAGQRPKLRYAHQGGQNPPIVVVHGTSLDQVTDSYRRYLEGQFRNFFALDGTPLRIEWKNARNPYVE